MSAGALLIACAMGCYQSYFCMSAILLVIALMQDLLDGKYGDWVKLILTALRYVLFLALGMVVYFIVLKVSLFVTGTELVSYKGMDEMGAITVSQMIERVKAAYLNFGGYYLNVKGIYHGIFPILSLSALAVTFTAVIRMIIKNGIHKKPMMLIISALIIIIFPFGCFLAYLMAQPGDVHQLMLYPAVLPLILPCIVIDRLKLSGRKIKDRVTVAGVSLLIALQVLIAYEFAFITNRAYFCMSMTYENTYAYFTKLSAKIEMTDGFKKDTRIALLGYATMDTAVPETYMTGVITGNTALNIYTRTTFMHYFLGSAYYYASPEQKDAITASEEYIAMPCYPEDGSIKVIDGIITVKFS